ncbi:hypothetical protein H4582DRAFT_2073997 [Lactarius indigo]|nr:hypothetical protein H4582DRAFT_2073997 [Lactarius indigo]
MESLGCIMQPQMLIDLAQRTQKPANTYSKDFRQPNHYQGEAAEPDDLFSPDMDIDLGSPDAAAQAVDNLAYLGMDLNISDSEMDHTVLSEAGSGFMSSDSDSEAEAEAEVHPALVAPSIGHPDTSDPSSFSGREPAGGSPDEGNDFVGADIPEVVRRLQTQLLSGYIPPNHPPIDDPRGCNATTGALDMMMHKSHKGTRHSDYRGWLRREGLAKVV